jgi:urease accessory protein
MLCTPPAGSAHLTFTRDGAATVLTRAFATNPAKLIQTRRRSETCWVYAATLGGGFVGGDRVHLHAEVSSGARALLTTQASTKVYRSQQPCSQTIEAIIGAGAFLAVVPDPIVCFAGADFTQSQRYELDAEASLVVVDWLTSGRHGCGERWAFSRYQNRVEIRRGSEWIFLDGLVLEPDTDAIAERMSHFNVLLTAVVTGPLVATAAADLFKRVSDDAIAPGADLIASASRLRDGGTLLRMAGTTVEQVGHALRTSLHFVSALAGDDLWSRKW